MLTPQDIREKSFEKAVFGGYDMAGVDEFLDQVAGDLAAAQKENAVLKSKMKVLAESIEEYRATEEAMRRAMLSAQKMSVEIENEAKATAAATISDAQSQAAEITATARAEAERATADMRASVQLERAKYDEARGSSLRFIEEMRAMCAKQIGYLDALRDGAAESRARTQNENVVDDAVRRIESSVAKLAEEPAEPAAAPGARSAASDEPTQVFTVAREGEGSLPKYDLFSDDRQ